LKSRSATGSKGTYIKVTWLPGAGHSRNPRSHTYQFCNEEELTAPICAGCFCWNTWLQI